MIYKKDLLICKLSVADKTIFFKRLSKNLDDDAIMLWILNIPFGYYCLYLDFICMHGSAILIKDKVSLFLGFSGLGKSTILSLLVDNDNIMISEDVCLIDANTNSSKIIPSFPIIKNENKNFFKKIGKKVDININDNRNRSFFQIHDCFFAQPMWYEIENIYVLKLDETNSINQLSGMKKFEKVFSHLFKIPFEKDKKIFIDDSIEEKLLSKLSALLNKTNVYEIKRNDNIEDNIAFIKKNIEAR